MGNERIMTFDTQPLGLDIAVLGSAISCIGVIENNICLNHVAAMQIWAASNPILFLWALGTYKHWWSDGMSGLALMVLYGVFSITNVWGLMHV